MLKSPLFWKITTLIGCIVLLSLPLMMVRELINERADYRSEVVDAIEQSTSGSQKLAGPLIAIPITETLTRMENQKEVNYQRSWVYYWLPESLAVAGKQTVESRLPTSFSSQSSKTLHKNLPQPSGVTDQGAGESTRGINWRW